MPINPLIGAAAIAGGSSLINGIGNFLGINSANKQNIQLQQQQNEWNERMWHLNNEYNDPSAQMERLQKAGYSPTFSANTITGGTSNAPAQGTQPATVENPYPNIGEPFQQTANSIINAYSAESQTQLNQTRSRNETLLAEADVVIKGKEAGLIDSKKIYQDIVNQFQSDRSRLENNLYRAQISTEWAKVAELYSQAEKNKDDAALSRANKKFVEIQTDIYPYLTQAQMYHLRTSAAASWEHAVNETKLTPYQKSLLISQKSYYANLATEMKSEAELKQQEADLSKRLGIPISVATQLYGSTLQGISNILGSFAGGSGAALIRNLHKNPASVINGLK